jgi:hypothetical protein
MTQPLRSQSAARLSALAALACFVVMALMVVVAGAFTPGYSHLSQFISELGARGSPHEWVVRLAGFLPSGLLLLAFCRFAYAALPRSAGTTLGLIGLALYAAGYLVAAAYPCDLGCRPDKPSASQLIHNAAGLLGYLLAPAFLATLARAARAWPNAGRVVFAGYASAAVALGGLLTLSPASATAGLSQRALEFAVLAWVVFCGRYLARQAASVA